MCRDEVARFSDQDLSVADSVIDEDSISVWCSSGEAWLMNPGARPLANGQAVDFGEVNLVAEEVA
jgi:hypothetical protein